MEKTLGRKPKQLEELSVHQLPDEAAYLWQWYDELFNGGRLTYLEMDAWSRLKRLRLAYWEVETLMNLDTLYLKVHNE